MTKENRETAEFLLTTLFPICRSITGAGFQKTAEILNKDFDYQIHRVQSGSQVFDWKVPPVWSISDAWVKNNRGEKVIDFKVNNLSVVNFSSPISGFMSKPELLERLHYLENHETWTPYRTSYYKEDWGFCCPSQLINSEEFVGPFEVLIDSNLDYQGHLVWTEAFHQGSSKKEILISTYACHPSLANDNLSGPVVGKLLFDYLKQFNTKYSYRFIVIPETIGALCFLNNHHEPNDIVAGFVVTTTAGPGQIGIKKAFDEEHWINEFAISALEESGESFKVYDFVPDGSDERQYSSPGFRIPTVSITSDKYYEYPEYHTSADNLEFISIDRLLTVLEIYKMIFHKIESSFIPKRTSDKGEYQLGKRNLFPSIGGSIYQTANSIEESSILIENQIEAYSWLMHLADGNRSVGSIAKKSKLPIRDVEGAVNIFREKELLKCLSDF